MAKKKFNQLDPATVTPDRLFAHANPSTGKAARAPISELIALLTAQTPVKTYADETALLANTNLAIGYIAYNASTGAFYLYNGPVRTDINNYTQISGTDHFQGIYLSSASLISSVPSAEPGDYAFVDEGVDYPVELWIWDENDTEWIQSGATGGTVLSVTGTTNRVTSTGGATPVIDIDAAYDASITAQIAAAAVGLWDDRGVFDASVAAYPSSGGSGTAGAILKGDIWTISVAGTLPTGQVVEIGDTVRALIDTPGNTQANWAILQNNLGLVPENVANKVSSIAASATDYPNNNAVIDYTVGVQHLWIPASYFVPTITDGCSSLTQDEIVTSLLNLQGLYFDPTTAENAQYTIVLPDKVTLTSFTFRVYWRTLAGIAAETVQWAIKAAAYSHDDPLTGAFGSFVTVNQAMTAVNDWQVTAITSSVGVASPTTGDLIAVQIQRQPASDTLAADAILQGVRMILVTTAAKDA